MAFSFSTSASEADAAVNSRASTGAAASVASEGAADIVPPAVPPANSLLEVAAGDLIPSSSSGGRGKIGWDPSRLSAVAEIGDNGCSNAGSGAAIASSGNCKAKIGWDPSRVGIADDHVSSSASSRAAVATSGGARAQIGWDASRVGVASSGVNDAGCLEILGDRKSADIESAGSGSSKAKIGWDPSRLGAVTAGQPAAAGGGGGGAALSSPQQQGELESEGEVAAGVGGGGLTTTLTTAGRLRAAPLFPSPAERGEQEECQGPSPPPTEQQQEPQQQQREPRQRIGWDPTRASVALAVPANVAPPSSTRTLPAASAEKRAKEVAGTQHIALPPPSLTTAAAPSDETEGRTAPGKIGWNASRIGNPAIPAPTMNCNESGAPVAVAAGVPSRIKAGTVGWNASRVGNPIDSVPAMKNSAGTNTAVGATGAAAATAAKPRIGWNASRVGNPTVPSPVMNNPTAPAVAGAADVATAVTAAVAVAVRTVAGRGGVGEGAVAMGDGGGARRREVPLQLRAVFLYASTQRGIDLMKWFSLGGSGGGSGDEDEEGQQEAEGGEGGACVALCTLVVVALVTLLVVVFTVVILFCSCADFRLSMPCFAVTPPLPRVRVYPSGHRGPGHFDEGPIRARVGRIGGRSQGDD